MDATGGGILLAEDDRVDARAFLRALERLGVALPVTVARDGVEAWEMLSDAARARPRFVVLDINMPRLTGLDVLRRIRAEPALRELPVFVLTTSEDDHDLLDAMELEVSGYIVKAGLEPGLRRALVAAGAATA